MPIRRYLWIAVSLVLPLAFTVISLTRDGSPHGASIEEEPITGARPSPGAGADTPAVAGEAQDASPRGASEAPPVEPDAGPRPYP